jgi:N-acetylneuraminate synthase
MNLLQIHDSLATSRPNYIYVVAEAGINHNGDIDIAKKLIKMAKDAGCDAVKFQKRDLETVYGSALLDQPRESPWGNTQRAQKQALEFGAEEYKILRNYCREIGIDFSASAWDAISLDFLDGYDLSFQKVASAMATKLDFLEQIAKKKVVTLLSLGMCTLQEADLAMEIFRKYDCPVIPMHCVSTYPTPESDLNLNQIEMLRERYNVNVGYSGHEASVSPSIAAACLGVSVIERHITLDRSMYGSDQAASLEKEGLDNLVSVIRKIPGYFGTHEKIPSADELAVAKKLRYWE